MYELSNQTRRIIFELNVSHHELKKIRALFSMLTGKPVGGHLLKRRLE